MKSVIHYTEQDSLKRTLEHPVAIRSEYSRTYAKDSDGILYRVKPKQVNGCYAIMYELDRFQPMYAYVYHLFNNPQKDSE